MRKLHVDKHVHNEEHYIRLGAAAKYPGDACTASSDCMSGTCTDNLCAGKAIDETCSSDSDCNTGLYCNLDSS